MDARETATVLAALRRWQLQSVLTHQGCSIATNDGEFEPLDADEIDDLCERLNCGEV